MNTQTNLFSENRHLETLNRRKKHFKYYLKLFNNDSRGYFNIIILANSEAEMKRKLKNKYKNNKIKLVNFAEVKNN